MSYKKKYLIWNGNTMFLYESAGNLIATGTEYLKDYKHAVVFITMPRTLKEGTKLLLQC